RTAVISPWPSSELHPPASAVNAPAQSPIALTPEFKHDLPAMAHAISERTRLILLCSPNTPTGPSISNDEFEAFMAQVPSDVLIVLDEAYWEFNTDSTAVDGLAATKKYDNLVLVRT